MGEFVVSFIVMSVVGGLNRLFAFLVMRKRPLHVGVGLGRRMKAWPHSLYTSIAFFALAALAIAAFHNAH